MHMKHSHTANLKQHFSLNANQCIFPCSLNKCGFQQFEQFDSIISLSNQIFFNYTILKILLEVLTDKFSNEWEDFEHLQNPNVPYYYIKSV